MSRDDDFEWLFGPVSYDSDPEVGDNFVDNAQEFVANYCYGENSLLRIIEDMYQEQVGEERYTLTGVARYVAKQVPSLAIAWAARKKVTREG